MCSIQRKIRTVATLKIVVFKREPDPIVLMSLLMLLSWHLWISVTTWQMEIEKEQNEFPSNSNDWDRGSRLDIKIQSYQNKNHHGKDKTVSRRSYIYHGIPIPGKAVFILIQCTVHSMKYVHGSSFFDVLLWFSIYTGSPTSADLLWMSI